MSFRPLAPGKISVLTPTMPPRTLLLARARRSVAEQKRPADDHVIAVDWTGDGPGVTRNHGLERVTTEWVAFLDDDDEMLPHHLRACERAAKFFGGDVIYPIGRYDALGDDPLRQAGRPFSADRLRMGNFIPVTVMARTQAVLDVGGFPVGDEAPTMVLRNGASQRCEDWGLWLRMLRAGATFTPLHQITWLCHQHGGRFGNLSGESWDPSGTAVSQR